MDSTICAVDIGSLSLSFVGFVVQGVDSAIIHSSPDELDPFLLRRCTIPLELVPHLLEFVLKQRMVVDHDYNFEENYFNRSWFVYYDEERLEYLNRMFQAFKGWVVPLLFCESQAEMTKTAQTKRKRANE